MNRDKKDEWESLTEVDGNGEVGKRYVSTTVLDGEVE